MPHAIFSTVGEISSSQRIEARQLIPGVEPGGSRVGQPMKPALLIEDAWIEVVSFDFTGATDYNGYTAFLVLSQEPNLTPGFLMAVAEIGGDISVASSVGREVWAVDSVVHSLFHEHGSIWAPKYVGMLWSERGTAILDARVHLKYDVVMIPWVEWFVKWDFLDHVVDGEGQH